MQAKQLIDSAAKPGTFQRVLSLQFDAFWQNHSRKVLGAAALLVLYLLWCAGLCTAWLGPKEHMLLPVQLVLILVLCFCSSGRRAVTSAESLPGMTPRQSLTGMQEDALQRDVRVCELVWSAGRVWLPGAASS